MQSHLDKIKAVAEHYKNAISDINNKRNLWNTQTEQFIFETLITIKNSVPLEWTVRKVERMRNLESVELIFMDGMSGISEGGVAFLKTYRKIGGKLVFTQAYSGQILVLYLPPFVQELMPQPQPQLLGEIDPEDITADFIAKHVETFLNNMATWEGSDAQHRQNPIGFNRKTDE
jgi:hypothetical protein